MKRVAFFLIRYFPPFFSWSIYNCVRTLHVKTLWRETNNRGTVASEMLSRERESQKARYTRTCQGHQVPSIFLIPFFFPIVGLVRSLHADEATSFVPFLCHCSPITRRVLFSSPCIGSSFIFPVQVLFAILLFPILSLSLSLSLCSFFLLLLLFCRDGHFLSCLFEDIDVVGIASNKGKKRPLGWIDIASVEKKENKRTNSADCRWTPALLLLYTSGPFFFRKKKTRSWHLLWLSLS